MESCNYPVKKNCKRGFVCPNGYECCTEKNNSAGVEPIFGHCVKENTCDFSRGICTEKIGSVPNSDFTIPRYSEGYNGGYSDQQNYGENHECTCNRNMIITIVVFLLLLIIIFAKK